MAVLAATLALLAAVAPTGAQPALAQTPLGRWFDTLKVVSFLANGAWTCRAQVCGRAWMLGHTACGGGQTPATIHTVELV